MKTTKNVNLHYRNLNETIAFILRNCECKSIVCLSTDDKEELKLNFITSRICDVHRVAQYVEDSTNLYFTMSGRHTYNIAIVWSEDLLF